ncbi:MAG TPA: tRNA (adenosine(37)-N6)-threonylcarbamoyltransferase complex ATPase subunit type 1 TsaE [Beijerinckiaceae bacterium]|nr:tRNA (adenosine(37)-N6)-threonylcarbamoyltransferase complex ATPase subunit type 1 TsaE [Beijerinckiaceae bacterium]
MTVRSPDETTWRISLADEAGTDELANSLAAWVGADDLVTLSGDLGSGKTTLARALIRRIANASDLEVPSPTFTLMQVYSGPSFPIVHADLYRVMRAAELAELGWEEAAEGALVLVEWAERAQSALAPDRLDVSLDLDPSRGEDARVATLTGHGAMAPRLARAKAVHDLLAQSGFDKAHRAFMVGDASTRAYERLTNPDGRTALLMISPPRPDGPPIRFGKAYSALARLAEDVRPFLAVSVALRAKGISAPEVFACDASAGLAVLEDFGDRGFLEEGEPSAERYGEAAALLARLHRSPKPETLPLGESETYSIPPYDAEALSIEVELLLDWYAPHLARAAIPSGARATFGNLWRRAFEIVLAGATTWTLRDYHSPNLIWLGEREGLARVGVLDFQDCVLGHPAYDVVSLLQDARVTISDQMELRLLSLYAQLRRQSDPGFDAASFARAYAILGAQRATKILGIFARLDKRDHKPHYLQHLPRIERYLVKDLNHPAMSEIRAWYETYLPHALGATP